MTMNRLLKDVYYNVKSPAYLAGKSAVYKIAKGRNKNVRIKDVDAFLHKQHTYTLHKPVRRKFPRNKTIPAGLDTDWQADLVEVGAMQTDNNGFRYLLTCIDVLSKFAWVVALKSKESKVVAEGFKSILQSGRKPWRLMTDAGKEFVGAGFQKLMKESGIEHFTSQSPDVKGAVVERYNRTLKTRLWKHFTFTDSKKYIDVLQPVVKAINMSVCRTIGIAPTDVTASNAQAIRSRILGIKKPKVKFRYTVGQRVRIARGKHKLQKGYLANFTKEIFEITERLAREPPVYRLKDLKGEAITGIFYESELALAINNGRRDGRKH